MKSDITPHFFYRPTRFKSLLQLHHNRSSYRLHSKIRYRSSDVESEIIDYEFKKCMEWLYELG